MNEKTYCETKEEKRQNPQNKGKATHTSIQNKYVVLFTELKNKKIIQIVILDIFIKRMS